MSNLSRRRFLRLLAQGGGAATVSSFLPLTLRLPQDSLLTSEVVLPGREGASALAKPTVPGSPINSVYRFVVDPAGEGTHTNISDAIAAANSVVRCSIPRREIWGGAPARYTRHR